MYYSAWNISYKRDFQNRIYRICLVGFQAEPRFLTGMSDTIAIPAAAFDALPFGILLVDASTGGSRSRPMARLSRSAARCPNRSARAAAAGRSLAELRRGTLEYSARTYASGRAIVVVRDAGERERELEMLHRAGWRPRRTLPSPFGPWTSKAGSRSEPCRGTRVRLDGGGGGREIPAPIPSRACAPPSISSSACAPAR